jgi:uncharacterized coiled-coil protein SlyX
MATFQEQLDRSIADVAAQKTVIGSVETMLTNQAQQIRDLQAQVTNLDPDAIATKLGELADSIEANSAELAAAVPQNTPASTQG